jgi:hypothetical protein
MFDLGLMLLMPSSKLLNSCIRFTGLPCVSARQSSSFLIWVSTRTSGAEEKVKAALTDRQGNGSVELAQPGVPWAYASLHISRRQQFAAWEVPWISAPAPP